MHELPTAPDSGVDGTVGVVLLGARERGVTAAQLRVQAPAAAALQLPTANVATCAAVEKVSD